MIRDLIQLYLANYYGSDMSRGNREMRSAEADRTRNAIADDLDRRRDTTADYERRRGDHLERRSRERS